MKYLVTLVVPDRTNVFKLAKISEIVKFGTVDAFLKEVKPPQKDKPRYPRRDKGTR
jgi:hypothetical protein